MSMGQDQFGNFSGNPAPPKSSGAGKIILIVLLIMGVLGLLCCGGFGAMTYFGMKMGAEQIVAPLKSNPQLVEEIGDFQSASMNLTATGQEAQKNPNPGGQPAIVMDVRGSKGTAKLLITLSRQGSDEIERAVMRTNDGREIELLSNSVDVEMPEMPEAAGAEPQ